VTTDTQTPDTQAAGPPRRAGVGSLARSLLEDRVALLVILLVVVLVWFFVLSAGGYLVAPTTWTTWPRPWSRWSPWPSSAWPSCW
jgi:hypothetical protein